jgi:hypothetical protein
MVVLPAHFVIFSQSGLLLNILLCSDRDIFTYPLPYLPEFIPGETKTPFFCEFRGLSLNNQKILSGCVLRLCFFTLRYPVKKKDFVRRIVVVRPPKYLTAHSVIAFMNSGIRTLPVDAYVFFCKYVRRQFF